VPDVVWYDEALRSGEELVRLKAHALGAVVALVPATLALFISVNRRNWIREAVALQQDRPDFSLPREWRHYVEVMRDIDPFATDRVAAGGATVLTLADFAPEEREPYARHLADMRMGDRATVYLRIAGTVVATVALLRCATLPCFTPAESAALRRIQPLIEDTFLCAAEPESRPVRMALRGRGLTPREAEVADLVSRGATNAEIARSLHLGQATVKTHLTRIYTKLRVRSRTQLALQLAAQRDGECECDGDGDGAGAPAAG
jgi:DNA-binding CsgD family transcriptional regulator